MKKKCFIIIIISVMALIGCLDQSPTQDENKNKQNNRDLSDRNAKILETYESFLRGDLFAKGAAIGEGDFSDKFFIDELNYFTEGDKFTICDVNGDGIPDLYLNSTIC